MNWNVKLSNDLEALRKIHARVFGDELDRSMLKAEDFETVWWGLLLHQEVGPPVGYAVLRRLKDVAEIWLLGVVPEARQRKGGLALLDECENLLRENGLTKVKVSTYNHWKIMLSMLIRRDYEVTTTYWSDKRHALKVRLAKRLEQRRELRYALTDRCNFRCLFCHNEGQADAASVNGPAREADEALVYDVLDEAVRLGFTDLTFTGGEPLLKKQRLYGILRHLAGLTPPPAITVVTNGYLLDEQTIANLYEYPGEKKLHVSLHSMDSSTFKDVTGCHIEGAFEKVVENIKRSANAGLSVKVNHVVLQGFNHDVLLETIEGVRALGVTTIKLLELLVLDSRPENYKYFYESSAVMGALRSRFGDPVRSGGLRKRIFLHDKDTRFEIELQQLTCALGCEHCLDVRDKTLSPQLRYHPCFVRHTPDDTFQIESAGDLAQVFSRGDRLIAEYADKYKGMSPTLVLKETYVPDKRELFWSVTDIDALRVALQEEGYVLKSTNGFFERYYRPMKPGPEWFRFEKVVKLGQDSHNRTKVDLLCSTHRYEPASFHGMGVETLTHFLWADGPTSFRSFDYAERLLEHLGFKRFFEIDWPRLETWAKDDRTLSLSIGVDKPTVKAWGPPSLAQWVVDLFRKCNVDAIPLQTGLLDYISEPLRGS